MPSRMDPYPFVPPPLKLSSKIRKSIPAAVIMDVAFLAYLNKEFVLCESFWLIEQRIFGSEQCWEKRWTTMLFQWKQKEEMDWEDIAVAPKRGERRSDRASCSCPDTRQLPPHHSGRSRLPRRATTGKPRNVPLSKTST